MRLLSIPIFLVVVPVILGLPWCCTLMSDNRQRTLACLPMGYFLEFAVFQLLTFPCACLHVPFSAMCIAFMCVIGACVVSSALWLKRQGKYKWPKITLNGWTTTYLILFFLILGYQVYRGITLDRTYMSYDDATYVTMANDALVQNRLYVHEEFTGIGGKLNIHRAMQSSIVFPAFLAFASGVEVVTVEHTILDIYFLLLAYVIYAYLGSILFRGENTLVFLIVIEALYIYGNYSMYSPTMRLLGLDYVGKAILAVAFVPFLFGLLLQQLGRPYQRSTGLALSLLSAAALGLTIFGAVVMLVIVVLSVLGAIVFRIARLKTVAYIAYTGALPIVYTAVIVLYLTNAL